MRVVFIAIFKFIIGPQDIFITHNIYFADCISGRERHTIIASRQLVTIFCKMIHQPTYCPVPAFLIHAHICRYLGSLLSFLSGSLGSLSLFIHSVKHKLLDFGGPFIYIRYIPNIIPSSQIYRIPCRTFVIRLLYQLIKIICFSLNE